MGGSTETTRGAIERDGGHHPRHRSTSQLPPSKACRHSTGAIRTGAGRRRHPPRRHLHASAIWEASCHGIRAARECRLEIAVRTLVRPIHNVERNRGWRNQPEAEDLEEASSPWRCFLARREFVYESRLTAVGVCVRECLGARWPTAYRRTWGWG